MNLLEFMYTSFRLEWHLDDENVEGTPQISVVGLVKQQARLLPTFSIALLPLTPRAKIHQSDLRGFSFGQTVLHTIAVHLHGWLGRKHRTHYTRGLNATSVGLATGKSQVHGGTRPVDKANKPVMRTWGFLLSKAHKAWSGRLENLSIHPW